MKRFPGPRPATSLVAATFAAAVASTGCAELLQSSSSSTTRASQAEPEPEAAPAPPPPVIDMNVGTTYRYGVWSVQHRDGFILAWAGEGAAQRFVGLPLATGVDACWFSRRAQGPLRRNCWRAIGETVTASPFGIEGPAPWDSPGAESAPELPSTARIDLSAVLEGHGRQRLSLEVVDGDLQLSSSFAPIAGRHVAASIELDPAAPALRYNRLPFDFFDGCTDDDGAIDVWQRRIMIGKQCDIVRVDNPLDGTLTFEFAGNRLSYTRQATSASTSTSSLDAEDLNIPRYESTWPPDAMIAMNAWREGGFLVSCQADSIRKGDKKSAAMLQRACKTP